MGKTVGAVSTLAVLAGCLLMTGCVTMIWDHNAFQSAKVLEEGRNEVEIHSLADIPTNIGYARGIGNGTEIRASLGLTGEFCDVYGESPGMPMTGADFSLTRAIVDDTPNCVSVTVSAGGFHAGYWDEHLFGGRLSAGINLAHYPAPWLGFFLPLKLRGVLANSGNYYAYVLPGIGVSIEPWRLIFRIAGNCPVLGFGHFGPESSGLLNYSLAPAPYLGLQLGYRWGEP